MSYFPVVALGELKRMMGSRTKPKNYWHHRRGNRRVAGPLRKKGAINHTQASSSKQDARSSILTVDTKRHAHIFSLLSYRLLKVTDDACRESSNIFVVLSFIVQENLSIVHGLESRRSLKRLRSAQFVLFLRSFFSLGVSVPISTLV